MLNTLEGALRDLGAIRVKSTKSGECTVLIAEFRDEIYLISVVRGRLTNKLISKVVPSSKVYSWSCDEIEYSPYGLYAIADTFEELTNKVVSKLRVLMRRGSQQPCQ